MVVLSVTKMPPKGCAIQGKIEYVLEGEHRLFKPFIMILVR